MKSYVIIIRKMHTKSCIFCVQCILNEIKIPYILVAMGKAILYSEPTDEQKKQLKIRLKEVGLDWLEDRGGLNVELVKYYIEEFAFSKENATKHGLSVFLAENLNCTYNTISYFFQKETGMNISDYCIQAKINASKTMLQNSAYTLEEIAETLSYSGKEYFCAFFKKNTSLTPGEYRKHFFANQNFKISFRRKKHFPKNRNLFPKKRNHRRK